MRFQVDMMARPSLPFPLPFLRSPPLTAHTSAQMRVLSHFLNTVLFISTKLFAMRSATSPLRLEFSATATISACMRA